MKLDECDKMYKKNLQEKNTISNRTQIDTRKYRFIIWNNDYYCGSIKIMYIINNDEYSFKKLDKYFKKSSFDE